MYYLFHIFEIHKTRVFILIRLSKFATKQSTKFTVFAVVNVANDTASTSKVLSDLNVNDFDGDTMSSLGTSLVKQNSVVPDSNTTGMHFNHDSSQKSRKH